MMVDTALLSPEIVYIAKMLRTASYMHAAVMHNNTGAWSLH
jgi:hypothetical protein